MSSGRILNVKYTQTESLHDWYQYKKDIEYIKAVFNDLSEALTQMAYGQVVLPVDIKGLLSDIQASLIKDVCHVPEVDCFEESLLLFLRSVRQQRQSIVYTTEVDRQMARLRDVRYFLVVLTGYPERVQEPPRLLWRWRDIKTLSVLFLSVVLSFVLSFISPQVIMVLCMVFIVLR